MKNNKNVRNIYMISRYTNTCQLCKRKINVGEGIWWNIENKKVSHKECFEKRRSGRPVAPRTSMTYPFSGSYRNGRKK